MTSTDLIGVYEMCRLLVAATAGNYENEMMLTSSPLNSGADFGADDRVGRRDAVARVERAIQDGLRLFVTGPRGSEKTTILRTAQRSMVSKGAIVLYVNAETTPDVGDLIEEIAEASVGQGLKMKTPATLDSSANNHQQIARLAKTLDVLDKAAGAQPEGRTVALIIDEFSALMARFGVTAESQIRAVVQTHQNLAYILSGSGLQLMMDMTSKSDRPFYRGGANLYLRSQAEST